MDIRNLNASQKYAAAKPATVPLSRSQADDSPLPEIAKDFAGTLREGEQIAMQAMTGDADPHALVQALAQTELAVEAAVTVRNKVVEAYQEILRMPV
ncbi:flagellar hook-basal body complex protein FliE [Shimia sp.]|uniref:flagellar hook-basal body complex protein FliE n=1 Tax=Shimia sp. TaxID=1954381 RepID=UPI003299477C